MGIGLQRGKNYLAVDPSGFVATSGADTTCLLNWGAGTPMVADRMYIQYSTGLKTANGTVNIASGAGTVSGGGTNFVTGGYEVDGYCMQSGDAAARLLSGVSTTGLATTTPFLVNASGGSLIASCSDNWVDYVNGIGLSPSAGLVTVTGLAASTPYFFRFKFKSRFRDNGWSKYTGYWTTA